MTWHLWFFETLRIAFELKTYSQRGRQGVTSAPFNAAGVRDREKWVHQHQLFSWSENNSFLFSPWNVFKLWPLMFQNHNRQNWKVLNPLPKVSIWGPRGEVSASRERQRTRRSSRRLPIRCCSRPPSDGARNSQPGSFTGQLLSISWPQPSNL